MWLVSLRALYGSVKLLLSMDANADAKMMSY